MKKIIRKTLIATLIYLIFSFVIDDLSFRNWTKEDRVIFVFISIASIEIYYLFKKIKDLDI